LSQTEWHQWTNQAASKTFPVCSKEVPTNKMDGLRPTTPR
jgi:hypothetical protein